MIELLVLFVIEICATAVIISVIVGVGAIALLIFRAYFRRKGEKQRRGKINNNFKEQMRVLREPQVYKEEYKYEVQRMRQGV